MTQSDFTDDSFCSRFKALNYFSSSQVWMLTANTTVKFCCSRCCLCLSCATLLATRLCSS